jgi:hypothetical protein
MKPEGRFYHIRELEDDMPESDNYRKPKPKTQLDFVLQISRVTEFISIGMSFARTLKYTEENTAVNFAFRWRGLAGRHLSSWVEPLRSIYSGSPSKQDVLVQAISVPLETPESSTTQHVEAVVSPLFACFGGYVVDTRVIDEIVRQTLGRRF